LQKFQSKQSNIKNRLSKPGFENQKMRKSEIDFGKSKKTYRKQRKGKQFVKNKKRSQLPKEGRTGKKRSNLKGKKKSITSRAKAQFGKIRAGNKNKPNKNKGKGSKDKDKPKKEEKKFLKSIAMTSLPTEKALEDLWDIYWTISNGLEDCVVKVLSLN